MSDSKIIKISHLAYTECWNNYYPHAHIIPTHTTVWRIRPIGVKNDASTGGRCSYAGTPNNNLKNKSTEEKNGHGGTCV